MDPDLQAFRHLAGGAGGHIDLGLAALTIARIEHPELRPEQYLPHLDDLARRSDAGRESDPGRAVDRLRRFLFEDEGFRGNAEDYYDPRNSCLNDVLARKLGIPITLSVLTMEVGRRVGLALEGIGLPDTSSCAPASRAASSCSIPSMAVSCSRRPRPPSWRRARWGVPSSSRTPTGRPARRPRS